MPANVTLDDLDLEVVTDMVAVLDPDSPEGHESRDALETRLRETQVSGAGPHEMSFSAGELEQLIAAVDLVQEDDGPVTADTKSDLAERFRAAHAADPDVSSPDMSG